MEYLAVKGLVLREVLYKESDRILTVFTDKEGRITAKAQGAVKSKSKLSAATQQLTYSDFILYKSKGKWLVKEAAVIEDFAGLRRDIAKFALGCYFAECMESLSLEEEPEPEILRLGLNCLYSVSNSLHPDMLVKAAFEMKIMSMTGYQPETEACRYCGKEPENPAFSVSNGFICCRECADELSGTVRLLDRSALQTMRYIISAPLKKILSFETSAESGIILGGITEEYLLTQSGRKYATLDYLKKL